MKKVGADHPSTVSSAAAPATHPSTVSSAAAASSHCTSNGLMNIFSTFGRGAPDDGRGGSYTNGDIFSFGRGAGGRQSAGDVSLTRFDVDAPGNKVERGVTLVVGRQTHADAGDQEHTLTSRHSDDSRSGGCAEHEKGIKFNISVNVQLHQVPPSLDELPRALVKDKEDTSSVAIALVKDKEDSTPVAIVKKDSVNKDSPMAVEKFPASRAQNEQEQGGWAKPEERQPSEDAGKALPGLDAATSEIKEAAAGELVCVSKKFDSDVNEAAAELNSKEGEPEGDGEARHEIGSCTLPEDGGDESGGGATPAEASTAGHILHCGDVLDDDDVSGCAEQEQQQDVSGRTIEVEQQVEEAEGPHQGPLQERGPLAAAPTSDLATLELKPRHEVESSSRKDEAGHIFSRNITASTCASSGQGQLSRCGTGLTSVVSDSQHKAEKEEEQNGDITNCEEERDDLARGDAGGESLAANDKPTDGSKAVVNDGESTKECKRAKNDNRAAEANLGADEEATKELEEGERTTTPVVQPGYEREGDEGKGNKDAQIEDDQEAPLGRPVPLLPAHGSGISGDGDCDDQDDDLKLRCEDGQTRTGSSHSGAPAGSSTHQRGCDLLPPQLDGTTKNGVAEDRFPTDDDAGKIEETAEQGDTAPAASAASGAGAAGIAGLELSEDLKEFATDTERSERRFSSHRRQLYYNSNSCTKVDAQHLPGDPASQFSGSSFSQAPLSAASSADADLKDEEVEHESESGKSREKLGQQVSSRGDYTRLAKPAMVAPVGRQAERNASSEAAVARLVAVEEALTVDAQNNPTLSNEGELVVDLAEVDHDYLLGLADLVVVDPSGGGCSELHLASKTAGRGNLEGRGNFCIPIEVHEAHASPGSERKPANVGSSLLISKSMPGVDAAPPASSTSAGALFLPGTDPGVKTEHLQGEEAGAPLGQDLQQPLAAHPHCSSGSELKQEDEAAKENCK